MVAQLAIWPDLLSSSAGKLFIVESQGKQVVVSKLKVGLVGAGVFAGYHAQKAAQSDIAELVGVYDLSSEAAQTVIDKVGQGEVIADLDMLILASQAIVIATPVVTHSTIAARALRAGRHVLVEKPLALSAAEADALVSLAKAKNLVLQVGHQERLVFEAMGVVGAPETPSRIEAVRAAPPSPNGRCEDVSVIFDLMIHDIDLANAVFETRGEVASAEGRKAHTALVDEVHTEIRYPNGVAVLEASRCAKERKRTMKLEYPSGVVEIDFLAKTVRNETPFDIQLDVTDIIPDPLMAADEAFYSASLGQHPSPIPGEYGARAAALAEAVENAANHEA